MPDDEIEIMGEDFEEEPGKTLEEAIAEEAGDMEEVTGEIENPISPEEDEPETRRIDVPESSTVAEPESFRTVSTMAGTSKSA